MRAFRAIMFSAATLLLFLTLYVGGYYAMVTAERVPSKPAFTSDGAVIIWSTDMVPEYQFGGDWSAILFRPIHEIDRRVRPEVWRSFTTPVHMKIEGAP